ncbi:MAG TPA: hypothetical protein VHE55_08860 [Fimbriimonadaceae bacterium]|nr:hypothetical protein [Fimbriimonadaceae bacterium]
MPLKPLPHRLSDCVVKDPSQTEILLIQDGPAVQAARRVRDRLTQAVLPVGASITKIKGARLDKLFDDETVKSIIAALGVGIHLSYPPAPGEFDMTRLRYGKLIIATKPTPAGRFIRDQIVSLLFRFNRPLLEGGHVYRCALDKRPEPNEAFENRVMKPATRVLIPVRSGRSLLEVRKQLE